MILMILFVLPDFNTFSPTFRLKAILYQDRNPGTPLIHKTKKETQGCAK